MATRSNGHEGPGGENAGWTVLSYMIGGMAFYGGLGWLIDRWTRHSLFMPIGMLVGIAVSITLIIYRYGRSSS